MMQISDAALADLKDRNPCHEVAARFVTLRQKGREWIGPCPICSIDTAKRTATKFSIKDERWMCAVCRDGGDVIELVRKVEKKSFVDAVAYLGGIREIDPAEAERRRLAGEAKRAADERAAAEFRERERGTLYEMWKRARRGAEAFPVLEYLSLRGLGTAPMEALRGIADMPYYDSGKKDSAIIHRGPAMLAAFTRGGKFAGVHITWLDGRQGKGKLALPVEGGEPGGTWPAKKMRGSKAGAHIELVPSPFSETTTLIIGEGIETTLSVWCAMDGAGVDLSGTAFWAAGDLGNLGGRAAESVAHPSLKDKAGRVRKVPGPVADFSSQVVAIPDSVTEVIILGDGDSDPFTTRCTLARACARFAKPGRTARVAFAPAGGDFNDIWRADRDAAAVCALIDAGTPLTADDVVGLQAAAPPDRAAIARPNDGAAEGGGHAAFPSSADNVPDDFSSLSPSSPLPPTEENISGATLANNHNGGPPLEDEPPIDSPEISEATFRFCAELDHSDTDNATRLIEYLGRDLLVRQEDDVAAGQWLAWSKTHWDLSGGEALAHLLGQRVGDLIKIEARYMDFTESEARAVSAAEIAAKNLKTLDPYTDDADVLNTIEELKDIVAKGQKARNALASRKTGRRKWGVSSKNRAKISAMLECAAPRLRRHPDAFNADQLKVATLTHTLTFRPMLDPENPDADGKRPWIDPQTGRPRYRLIATPSHNRADMLTAVIPFAFNPQALCPDFNVFLDLFQPEPNKRRTIQQYAGMGMTGQPVQRIMFHTGTGGNGKSVFLEVMTRVLGDGLAVGIPSESVSGQVQNNPSAPTPDIARCYGKRFLRVAEMPKGEPLKQNTIKKLTGGERWPVRTMYKGYFEFKPTAKPHMSGNDVPPFDGSDGGLKRRLIFMPWSVTLPVEQHRDFEDVVSEIVVGGSGILNWLIEGALDFMNKGLVISEDVAATTAEQFAEMDPCEQFIMAHVVPDPGGAGVTARAMYDAYKLWCDANGRSHMFETRFGRTMKGKLKRDDTKRVRVYLEVKLHDLPERTTRRDGDNDPPPPDDGGDIPI